MQSENGKPETTPRRIQRKRTKGWRMPASAVYVGRPTLYGNECVIGQPHPDDGRPMTAQDVVDYFRDHFPQGMREAAPRVLGGRDLCCWCPLDQPCHADVLLEFANAKANTNP